MPWRRMLLRGEATIASVGITLAAILLGTMGAAGWWMLHIQQSAAEAAREQQVEAVGTLLGAERGGAAGGGGPDGGAPHRRRGRAELQPEPVPDRPARRAGSGGD